MKKVFSVLVILFCSALFCNTAAAGTFTRLDGAVVNFTEESEFVGILLSAFGTPEMLDGRQKLAFVLITDEPDLKMAKLLCTEPEKLDISEEEPTSLYISLEKAEASQEYEDLVASAGAARVFAVKIDTVKQDFVQVYSFGMRGIIADTKGAKKFKRVD